MLKNELIQKIEESKVEIKNHINKKGIEKDEISKLIYKILEWEANELQIATNLYYIDWCTINEISEIMGKSQVNILNYFQLILYKIKLILNIENKKINNKYWVHNYLSKKKITKKLSN